MIVTVEEEEERKVEVRFALFHKRDFILDSTIWPGLTLSAYSVEQVRQSDCPDT